MRLVKLNIIWIIANIFLVAIAIKGEMSSLMFSLIMYFARYKHRASDYSLQLSLFVITCLTCPIFAEIILNADGAFFLCITDIYLYIDIQRSH